ncbi:MULTISPECIES: exopolysaccharide biosynthesis protein [unclassified Sphingomonas]|jgi:exopolysaccharide/PEP-CTERM locus tyrosine autokinase|uniref:exopolysaccharide biosynthesis protein n=1 Tax=unclassified Sphingomonas TaxID=196159 RepID=UPI0008312881|nr:MULTISPECIES: exopolysaccharide biosynthesis protein [unclassified Sphingomonas]
MNDHSPRRLKGSLIERAAEHFGLEAETLAPVAALSPAAFDIPPMPVIAPAPATVPEHSAKQAAPRPVSRRFATIDRARLAEQGMLVPGGPVDVLAEEFRLAKRQLLLTARAAAGKNADRARMVLVCSARPNEGKTFCATNLAISMAAERDVEILLVDADLAKPDILDRLGIDAGPGLLDVLNDSALDAESCVIETDIPKLSVLGAGTRSANDTELLASERARRVLDALATANPDRIVIFDSPPILSASPASVLALHVGQAMMVVRADRTTESDIRQAVALLDGCEHVQLLLNAATFMSGDGRFGSYYGEELAG